jgi:hypothetical protein
MKNHRNFTKYLALELIIVDLDGGLRGFVHSFGTNVRRVSLNWATVL